jgi:hypothetical protein
MRYLMQNGQIRPVFDGNSAWPSQNAPQTGSLQRPSISSHDSPIMTDFRRKKSPNHSGL